MTNETMKDGERVAVNGMTRAEFERHLRVSYQHDNVRAHVNAPTFGTTADQERAIAERVDLNYLAQATCPGCQAWDLGMAEVNFAQGCTGCAERMRKANGLEARAASPQSGEVDFSDAMSRIAYYAGFKEGEASAAETRAASPIGKVLSEAEMFEARMDGKSGNVIWFNSPTPGYIYGAPTERMSETALTPEVRAALNACINYAQAAGWEPADVARQWLDSKSTEPTTDTVQPFIIEEGERDGNWREFSVNGHGGFLRVVARMEDDDQDLPLGKQVAQWILSGVHSDNEKSDERVSLTYVEQEALRAFAGRILEAQEQPIAVSLRAAELIHKVLDNAVSPQASFMDEQIALAKNIAMHADEASILAGNDVCRALMKKCAETIRALINQTDN